MGHISFALTTEQIRNHTRRGGGGVRKGRPHACRDAKPCPQCAAVVHRGLAGFVRVPVTDILIERAEALAWDHGLRAYDAVQLASALTWQESVGSEIVLATFDHQLWDAAPKAGLRSWPENLTG